MSKKSESLTPILVGWAKAANACDLSVSKLRELVASKKISAPIRVDGCASPRFVWEKLRTEVGGLYGLAGEIGGGGSWDDA